MTKVAREILQKLKDNSAQIYRMDMGPITDDLYFLVYSADRYTKISSGTFGYLETQGFIVERSDSQPKKGDRIYIISNLGKEALEG